MIGFTVLDLNTKEVGVVTAKSKRLPGYYVMWVWRKRLQGYRRKQVHPSRFIILDEDTEYNSTINQEDVPCKEYAAEAALLCAVNTKDRKWYEEARSYLTSDENRP